MQCFIDRSQSFNSRQINRQISTEAANGDVLLEKVFLEIFQNSEENTCAKVSF